MTFNEWLEVIPNVIAGAVFIVGVSFAFVYARYADWRLTDPGQSLMYLIISFDSLVLMNTVNRAVGMYPGQWLVRTIVWSALFWSIGVLFHTLIKILRNGKPITLWAHVIPGQKKVETK